MSELTTQVLRELAPQDLAAHLPAAVRIGDRTGVILRVADIDEFVVLEVYSAGHITNYGRHVLEISPLTDPAEETLALAEAVEALTICRRVGLEMHAEERQNHQAKLAAIRDYAIASTAAGIIGPLDLAMFLAEFDLVEPV